MERSELKQGLRQAAKELITAWKDRDLYGMTLACRYGKNVIEAGKFTIEKYYNDTEKEFVTAIERAMEEQSEHSIDNLINCAEKLSKRPAA